MGAANTDSATVIERSLHVSLTLHGPAFIFTQPIAFVMFALIVTTAVLPFIRKSRNNRAQEILKQGGI